MKRERLLLVGYILSLGVLVSVVSSVAKAASTAAVTATVTARNISVALTTDGSVSFGVVALNSTKDTTSTGVNDTEALQNDGNVAENFNIKAANTSSWTLGGTAGANTYTLKFCTSNCDSSPTWSSVGVDPAYQTLASNVAASGAQTFDLQVGTPTTSVSYSEQSMTVTIQAVIAS